MYGQDAFAPFHIGTVDHHAAIKAARAQQRRIEHIGTVGGGHQNNTIIRLKAVHLYQQLIERLLTFIVAAAQASAAMTAYCVDLVDEDNAGRILLALLKKISYARCAHTY